MNQPQTPANPLRMKIRRCSRLLQHMVCCSRTIIDELQAQEFCGCYSELTDSDGLLWPILQRLHEQRRDAVLPVHSRHDSSMHGTVSSLLKRKGKSPRCCSPDNFQSLARTRNNLRAAQRKSREWKESDAVEIFDGDLSCNQRGRERNDAEYENYARN